MRLVWGFWNYMLSVPQPSVGRLTYLAGSTKVYRTTEDLGPSMLALGSRNIFDGVNKDLWTTIKIEDSSDAYLRGQTKLKI